MVLKREALLACADADVTEDMEEEMEMRAEAAKKLDAEATVRHDIAKLDLAAATTALEIVTEWKERSSSREQF